MKEAYVKYEAYEEETSNTMGVKRSHFNSIRLMIPQGYHGILYNIDNYILEM